MGAEQKVVVITGASQGIGAELVKGFRDRNYRVVANSRSIKPSPDPDIVTVAGDVADPKTAERIVSQAIRSLTALYRHRPTSLLPRQLDVLELLCFPSSS